MRKKKVTKPKYKPVYIEWCDAYAINPQGWITEEEALDRVRSENWKIRQIGFILEETSEYISLTFNCRIDTEEGNEILGDLIKIPKTWIRKRVNLGPYIDGKK